MAAAKVDRPLPIREAGSHPALGIERRTFDVESSALDFQGPTYWEPSPGNSALNSRIQNDVVRFDRLRLALRTDPRAFMVRLAILLPDLKQH